MMGIGAQELLVLAVVGLLVFGFLVAILVTAGKILGLFRRGASR